MTGNLTYFWIIYEKLIVKDFFLELNNYDRSWTYVDYPVSNNETDLKVRSHQFSNSTYHLPHSKDFPLINKNSLFPFWKVKSVIFNCRYDFRSLSKLCVNDTRKDVQLHDSHEILKNFVDHTSTRACT